MRRGWVLCRGVGVSSGVVETYLGSAWRRSFPQRLARVCATFLLLTLFTKACVDALRLPHSWHSLDHAQEHSTVYTILFDSY